MGMYRSHRRDTHARLDGGWSDNSRKLVRRITNLAGDASRDDDDLRTFKGGLELVGLEALDLRVVT